MSEVKVGNRIGGAIVPAKSGKVFERRNPADAREIVSIAPDSDSADVEAAIDAACEASLQWGRTTPTQRANILSKASRILDGKVETLVADMVKEQGKLAADARIECSRTPKNLELYATEAYRLSGATFPSDDTQLVYSVRGPVGVVGVITPWNFPLNLASRKIGPALAAGNAVVFKPSPLAPLMGDHLVSSFEEAGLPAGVLNVVHGFAAGAPLVADKRVNAITFTGSNATGEKIHREIGIGRRVQLELGGKNPVLVLDDADIDLAVNVVMRSSFSLAGQACTGAGRIIVSKNIFDVLLERVLSEMKKIVLGPGNTPESTMGPLVDGAAIASMEAAIAAGVKDGVEIAIGGRRSEAGELQHGFFFEPTILLGAKRNSFVVQNEIFGPVVTFESVEDIDEAINSANDVSYGLSASICTQSIAKAQHCAQLVEAGMVRVNRPTVGAAFNAPFGGIKQSGTATHKEQYGPTVMDFYTLQRTIWMGS